MKPTYSIIVPVYNSQEYLNGCLDSILAQENTDFELLLVDDGSTDESCRICDEYAERDARVRVFHKKNGGVSSARNYGIREMRGEWVAFIDSDDWVDAKYVPGTVFDADFIVQKWARRGDEFIDRQISRQRVSGDAYNQFMYENLGDDVFRSPWGTFMRTCIIKENHLRFDENMRLGEDTVFMMWVAAYAKTVMVINEGTYYYRHVGNWARYGLTVNEILYGLEKFLEVYKCIPFRNPKNANNFLHVTSSSCVLKSKKERFLWRLQRPVAELTYIGKYNRPTRVKLKNLLILLLARMIRPKVISRHY
ncbi:MAG: glycosyltransferase family A protein [Bacteroidia bacterium]|nr:glycosyltransferase family A protein [Bacteroidia bacterium]